MTGPEGITGRPGAASGDTEQLLAALSMNLRREPEPETVTLMLRDLFEKIGTRGERGLLRIALGDRKVGLRLIELALDAGRLELAEEWSARLQERASHDGAVLLLRSIVRECLGDLDGALAACDRMIELDPRDPDGYLRRAEVRMRLAHSSGEGDAVWDLALADCDVAVRLAPRRPDAHLDRARALSVLGQLDDADGEYEQVIQLDPGCLEGHLEHGLLLLERQDNWAALDAFDSALHLDENSAAAHAGKGDTLLALGSDSEALDSFTRALDADEEHGVARLGRAVASINLGHRSKRRHRLNEMRAHYDRAIDDGEQAVLLDGENPWSHGHLGRALRAAGAFEAAVRHLEQACTLARAEPALEATLRAEQGETLRRFGVVARSDDLLKEALERLYRAAALGVDPTELAWTHEAIGRTFLDMSEHNRALDAFEQSIALSEVYGWALVGKGTALIRTGADEEAARTFDQLDKIAADRQRFKAWAEVGRFVALADGDPAFAGGEALQPFPLAEEYLDRAQMFEQLGQHHMAERDRVMAVGLEPDRIEALCAVAWSYLREFEQSEAAWMLEERYRDAARRGRRALELVGDEEGRPDCLHVLGKAHLKLGEYSEAVYFLEQATQARRFRDLDIRLDLEAAQRSLRDHGASGAVPRLLD